MTAAKLQGKVAIVTGAALGMGNAVAHRFIAEGANVIVADIREAEGKALASSWMAIMADISPAPADHRATAD